MALIRGPVVFAVAWILMELMRNVLHLGTGWPLWTIALITAVALRCRWPTAAGQCDGPSRRRPWSIDPTDILSLGAT